MPSNCPTQANRRLEWATLAFNQLDTGVQYDAAGDVSSDTSGNTYTYDAEGRVVTVGNGETYTSYLYDAEGRRVAKLSGNSLTSSPPTNLYVLSAGGEQLTELNGSLGWAHSNVYARGKLLTTYNGTGAHFQFSDWLGTRRVQALANGTIEEQCSSLPYGDNLSCIGGSDATEHHFTGKERDSETGLDYFGARYYASNMGRWMSPDWADKPEAVPYSSLDNPQSLNLYGYVLNNPVSKSDPDGHIVGVDDVVVVGVLGAAAVTTYLATPQGQRMVSNALSGAGNLLNAGANALSSLFHSSDKPAPATPGTQTLPANPNDLTNAGYHDTSHPDAAAAGHQTFENPQTGDKVRFDKGTPGATGNKADDHYHRENPNSTGKGDRYLDAQGNPVPKGSEASHLKPQPPPPQKEPGK